LARTDDPDAFVSLYMRHDDQSIAVRSADQYVSSLLLRMIRISDRQRQRIAKGRDRFHE
jgi:hypothetical protein